MYVPDFNESYSVSDDKKYLTDWYKKEIAKLDDNTDYIGELNRKGMQKRAELDNVVELDLMKCRKIKEQLDAMPELYRDPTVKRFSDECRNDMTRIFVDTFFKLNWRLIIPSIGHTFSIEDKINRFQEANSQKGQKALLDTLIDERLMTYGRGPLTTENRFDLLANYFKWSKGERRNIQMNHIPQRPYVYAHRDGYQHLNRVLDLFEETILSRNIRDKSPEKIERMKDISFTV